eukprot:3276-Eustigmatos_ZCMA.PRE.1
MFTREQGDAIDALVSLIATEDINAGRYAAFALSNIAANANYRDKVVNDGGVPALVSLACCGDANAQRQALTGTGVGIDGCRDMQVRVQVPMQGECRVGV